MKEIPILKGIQRQVGKDKIEIVAINFKHNKKIYRKMVKALKEIQITLTHDRRGSISKKYNVKSILHIFIINKQGKVAHIHKGYSEKMLPKLVDELNELILET